MTVQDEATEWKESELKEHRGIDVSVRGRMAEGNIRSWKENADAFLEALDERLADVEVVGLTANTGRHRVGAFLKRTDSFRNEIPLDIDGFRAVSAKSQTGTWDADMFVLFDPCDENGDKIREGE